jgi:hypothetical protein
MVYSFMVYGFEGQGVFLDGKAEVSHGGLQRAEENCGGNGVAGTGAFPNVWERGERGRIKKGWP